MTDGDWLFGLGCASAAYAVNISAAAARLNLRPDGHVRAALADPDIGTGAYTVLALTIADHLGVRTT